MPQFRKKPVVIEAVEYRGSNTWGPMPEWLDEAYDAGTVRYAEGVLLVGTLEGPHFASPGDWIIRGVKGELYPCKPDIFTLTHEAI